jgi:D-hydroxyproline dehydrogenase subunit gamma
MFRPRPDAAPGTVAVIVEGRRVLVPTGASAAAAMLSAGLRSFRETSLSGVERGAYCMIGVCFDCLAEIDGVPNRVSCMTEARPGMRIRRQSGACRIGPAA